MDTWRDCVSLVSNEREIVFLESITNTTKSDFHSFGSKLYNCVSDYATDDTVVELNRCWTSDVEHFMQGITKGHAIFFIDET